MKSFLPPTVCMLLALTACKKPAEDPRSPITMAVTDDGFTASRTHVKVGEPVSLKVTRKVENTCATEIVIKEYGITQKLPLGVPVEVAFTPTHPGPIHYACAMNMVTGDFIAE